MSEPPADAAFDSFAMQAEPVSETFLPLASLPSVVSYLKAHPSEQDECFLLNCLCYRLAEANATLDSKPIPRNPLARFGEDDGFTGDFSFYYLREQVESSLNLLRQFVAQIEISERAVLEFPILESGITSPPFSEEEVEDYGDFHASARSSIGECEVAIAALRAQFGHPRRLAWLMPILVKFERELERIRQQADIENWTETAEG